MIEDSIIRHVQTEHQNVDDPTHEFHEIVVNIWLRMTTCIPLDVQTKAGLGNPPNKYYNRQKN